MPAWLNGLLTVLVAAVLCGLMLVLVNFIIGAPVNFVWMILIGAGFGLVFGLQAGILEIYDLSTFGGWLGLVADSTWSLPNTIIGIIFGNLLFVWFGNLSKSQSKHRNWIVYMPPATKTSGFGVDVLQIWGNVNLGGAGQHERMHLLQSRIFGPLYYPIFALNYVINFILQGLWTFTIGGLLWLVKIRQKPYFRPDSNSVVSGFFGWIYYATAFEFWAYKTGNP